MTSEKYQLLGIQCVDELVENIHDPPYFIALFSLISILGILDYLIWNFIFIKVLMTCFTYVQLFIKWFYWMIQLWNDNLILVMFQKFDTALIQASIAYCANIIAALFYLMKKILNLIKTFFSFLNISDIWFFYFFIFCIKFWISLAPLFILFFNFSFWVVLYFW